MPAKRDAPIDSDEDEAPIARKRSTGNKPIIVDSDSDDSDGKFENLAREVDIDESLQSSRRSSRRPSPSPRTMMRSAEGPSRRVSAPTPTSMMD